MTLVKLQEKYNDASTMTLSSKDGMTKKIQLRNEFLDSLKLQTGALFVDLENTETARTIAIRKQTGEKKLSRAKAGEEAAWEL